jgi:hypothetical protein
MLLITITVGVIVAGSVTRVNDIVATVIIDAGATVTLWLVVLIGVLAIVLLLMCCCWYCYCC